MNKLSKQKTRIMKPVYFNLDDEKEKEISDWLDSKFSSFGGLVKDLLYLQMLQEKGLVQRVDAPIQNNSEVKEVENTEIEYDHNYYCNSDEADDFPC